MSPRDFPCRESMQIIEQFADDPSGDFTHVLARITSFEMDAALEAELAHLIWLRDDGRGGWALASPEAGIGRLRGRAEEHGECYA